MQQVPIIEMSMSMSLQVTECRDDRDKCVLPKPKGYSIL